MVGFPFSLYVRVFFHFFLILSMKVLKKNDNNLSNCLETSINVVGNFGGFIPTKV